MRAAVIHGARSVQIEERPEPRIQGPRDAVVRVVAACVCGSDLWGYRGVRHSEGPIGHELVGVVEQLGDDVTDIAVGDFVIAPFSLSDGSCQACRHGMSAACDHATFFGGKDAEGERVDGAQGERVRIPFADSSLVVVPGPIDEELIPHLLTLADVMSTGHHAAVSAGVGPGDVVAVVGDGAVGLCAVLAAHRLGASRIIAMSRNPTRQAQATRFGATDIVEERGDEARGAVQALLDGDLVDAVLECVGTKESMAQALAVVRGGGRVGYVGVPAEGTELKVQQLFSRNVSVSGGMAPARDYIPTLLPDVLDGTIRPGEVFDLELPLDEVAEAYAAMDERRAIKVLLKP
ncbi:zinc-binding dehydrogenase [Schumannella sp. 10F1B-5-1]|uniref:zinc-binding dehydrogenase n=1 Tax=Schumannella sp. 10F1B-5-1 TaxID=2590780 RepID=UPI0011311655|nr:zinc-binding dehydrogenase [Schumannella sp. 10F1B-5-1]TPW70070.1 zinc-binding dehydrogenase [Schumannella sp. 10F1B-5-1]